MLTLFAQVHEPQAIRGLDVFLRENWRVLLPLLLGLVGVYLLLPRVKRFSPAIGGGIAGVGLVLATLWWTRYETVWVEQLLFYVFAGLAVLGAGLMLNQHNPVHAALSFALVVLSSCGLFLLLAAPFLMAATIIIYAGAIVVTFLFVIMLAQQGGFSNADLRSREPFLGSLAGFLLLGGLAVILHRGYSTTRLDAVLANLTTVANAKTNDEANAVLGDPASTEPLKLKDEIENSIPGLKANPEIEDQVSTLEANWKFQDKGDRDEKLAAMKKSAAAIAAYATAARMWHGSLPADKGREAEKRRAAAVLLEDKLQPGDKQREPEERRDAPGMPKHQPLPAANVAALGKTLFTDHLIAVEMAGVLLLVATIGAIVIAGRKTEGLR